MVRDLSGGGGGRARGDRKGSIVTHISITSGSSRDRKSWFPRFGVQPPLTLNRFHRNCKQSPVMQ